MKLEHDVHAMHQLISEHQTTYDRLASQLHAPVVSSDAGDAMRHASNTSSSDAHSQVNRQESRRSDLFTQRASEYLHADPQQRSDEWMQSSRAGNEARIDQNHEDVDHARALGDPGQSQRDPVLRPSVRFTEPLDQGMSVPSAASQPQSAQSTQAPAPTSVPAESRVLREQRLNDESEEHKAEPSSLRSHNVAEMQFDDTTAEVNEKVCTA